MADSEKEGYSSPDSPNSPVQEVDLEVHNVHNPSESIGSEDVSEFAHQVQSTAVNDSSSHSDLATSLQNDENPDTSELLRDGNKTKLDNEKIYLKNKIEEENDESDEEMYESAEEGKDLEEDEDSNEEFIPVNETEKEACMRTTDTDFQSLDFDSEDKKENSETEDRLRGSDDEQEEQTDEQKNLDELEARKKAEDLLTNEEKHECKDKAQVLKNDGNTSFRNSDYDNAISLYTEALDLCPLEFHKERSIMFANRAACKMKQEFYEEAIKDSTHALDLHPHYIKAMLRRGELYEKTEKLDEALKDFQKVVELDPTQHAARATCIRLAEQIKDRNEKMKTEMMGKLKELGDMVLRPFGLSVNNFNLQQDPNTGSYSVQFQQNPGNNGK